jgi:hypothetical protein
MPSPVLVPARGRATLRVTATPRAVTEADRARAAALGWGASAPADDAAARAALLSELRARLVADAVFVPAGAAAPVELVERARMPFTPRKGSRGSGGGGAADGAEGSLPAAGAASSSPGEGGTPSLPAQTPHLVREALALHSSIRPFAPRLAVDRAALSDGEGGVATLRFRLWSTALSPEARAAAAAALAAAAGGDLSGAGGSAGGGGAGGGGVRAAVAITPVGSALTAARSSRAPSPAPGGEAAVAAMLATLPGGGATLTPGAARDAAGLAAGLHPSLLRDLAFSNASGTELVFTVFAEGPFRVLRATTSSPKHPATRIGLVAGAAALTAASGGGSAAAAALTAREAATGASAAALAALFAPGVLNAPPGAPRRPVLALAPGATLTVTVAFDPDAGAGMQASAAALLFGAAAAAAAGGTLPPVFSSTVRAGGGASSTLAATASADGRSAPAAAPDAARPIPDGTVTLGGAGGLAGSARAGDVGGLMDAAAARLRGD